MPSKVWRIALAQSRTLLPNTPHLARPSPSNSSPANSSLANSLLSSKLLSGPSWAESPVSAYMRYLESSLLSSDTSHHPRPPLPSPGLLPSPRPPFPFPSPSPGGLHNSASLPPLTPTSAFPSPTAFLDLLSPRSPYPLLSPGFRYPMPLTPNFALSPLPQPGILGAGPSPRLQPPPSPGLWFPQSPSGFLPILSPRWRDML
ncbi:protein HAIKU1-like [Zingiber officinale]|nr:protein HAIKU1-like [Zingiber officinale]